RRPAQNKRIRLHDVPLLPEEYLPGPLACQGGVVVVRAVGATDCLFALAAGRLPDRDLFSQRQVYGRGRPRRGRRFRHDAHFPSRQHGPHLTVGKDHVGVPTGSSRSSGRTQSRLAPVSASSGSSMSSAPVRESWWTMPTGKYEWPLCPDRKSRSMRRSCRRPCRSRIVTMASEARKPSTTRVQSTLAIPTSPFTWRMVGV